MQTFLPYPDFIQSAKCLDNKRLGKQRVEAIQILRTLIGISRGWQNHPAVKMWRGHELQLFEYAQAMCDEWQTVRQFDNTKCGEHLSDLRIQLAISDYDNAPPPWFGRPEFHDAHKSNLLRKDPRYYGQFGWDVSDDLPYVWPE